MLCRGIGGLEVVVWCCVVVISSAEGLKQPGEKGDAVRTNRRTTTTTPRSLCDWVVRGTFNIPSAFCVVGIGWRRLNDVRTAREAHELNTSADIRPATEMKTRKKRWHSNSIGEREVLGDF